MSLKKLRIAFPYDFFMDGKRAATVEFKALGTQNELRLVFGQERSLEANAALCAIRKRYLDFERRFSRFLPESELSFFNGNIGSWHAASPEMIFLAQKSLKAYDLTKGIFDPRTISVLEGNGYVRGFSEGDFTPLPECRLGEKSGRKASLKEDLEIKGNLVRFGARMDFGGIAKGVLTDLVAEQLFGDGWDDFLIDSGGDMYLAGKDEEGRNWWIGTEGLDVQTEFCLSGVAVATSGISRRKWTVEGKRVHHLIDPRSPDKFSFFLRSVSVVASSVREAEVWAKTLFILGSREGFALAQEKGLAAIFLTYRSGALCTPAANKYLCAKNGN